MHESIIARYHDRLSGVLSCYDRIIITGTIPGACYAAGMTSFLYMHKTSITRQLLRLRKLGIIKKIAGTYRYYLTKIGRSFIAACCRLTEQTIVPALA